MLKIAKFTDVCMTGDMHYTVLVFAFNFDLFKFSAAILEKGVLVQERTFDI